MKADTYAEALARGQQDDWHPVHPFRDALWPKETGTMTHPTRTIDIPPLREAAEAISDEEMTRMCLCVNQMFGNEQAKKLMNLIVAARRHALITQEPDE